MEKELLAGVDAEVSKLQEFYDINTTTSDDFSFLDKMIQVNLGEIRTFIQVSLLRPIMKAFSQNNHSTKIDRIVDQLLFDEVNHISYSAEIIEVLQHKFPKDTVQALFEKRSRELDDETKEEVGGDLSGFVIDRINSNDVEIVDI